MDNVVDNDESEDSERSASRFETVRARTASMNLSLTSWIYEPLSEGVPQTPPSLACMWLMQLPQLTGQPAIPWLKSHRKNHIFGGLGASIACGIRHLQSETTAFGARRLLPPYLGMSKQSHC